MLLRLKANFRYQFVANRQTFILRRKKSVRKFDCLSTSYEK